MFGIESEVTVSRTPQGVEVSFGTKPEVRHFDSEDDAQRVLGRERVLWTAAFAISTGLTLAGLNSIKRASPELSQCGGCRNFQRFS